MILLVSVCKEKLHELEFVKPIEDTLRKEKIPFFTKHYVELSKGDLANASKVIICGTSLQDNEFARRVNLKCFNWIRDFNKPLLGICAGMQIIGLVNGGKVKKKTEIGFFNEKFDQSFLALNGFQEVWHLHNNSINFSKLKNFDVVCSGNGISQAVKSREKEIYGVLFHPEVRNKNLILEFVKKKA
ncbi:GMP synthase [glutamine-hydrolyzing] subunit A [uncultured archaeon]|nr:GMP synthase [glutamine-hydrolyzing] subunit A [uncultured archaeon]